MKTPTSPTSAATNAVARAAAPQPGGVDYSTIARSRRWGLLAVDIRFSSVLGDSKDRNTISIREAHRRLIQLLLSAWTSLLSQVLGKDHLRITYSDSALSADDAQSKSAMRIVQRGC